jgi:hypothetical protein
MMILLMEIYRSRVIKVRYGKIGIGRGMLEYLNHLPAGLEYLNHLPAGLEYLNHLPAGLDYLNQGLVRCFPQAFARRKHLIVVVKYSSPAGR